MDGLRSYILSIVATCLCCVIFRSLVQGKGSAGAAVNTMCAIILAMTVIYPVARFRIKDLSQYTQTLKITADSLADDGVNISQSQLRSIISEKTCTYILEKASLYDCDIDVDVILSEESIPTPEQVQITGSASPYARTKLSQIIENDLGIPKEMQKWTYQN